ncbi:MAG: amidohydrolase [Chitinophagia bacterium]|jgi:predicted amidohydrolase YtcJ|nr:amidohydrolase [Chitinophagia bacterium]
MRSSFFLFAIVVLFSCNTTNKADKVYVNGNIWTGDSSNPSATIIAIKGDKIIYVGNDPSKVSGGEVIDLKGKMMVPGFTDNHTHFLSAGYGLSSVHLKDAMTKAAFIQRISDFCKSHPGNTWIKEGGWDNENWGGELPSKEWIDSVTGDHPIFISRYDGHMAFANSKAMELAGVNANTVSPDGGVVVKNAKGELTGCFKDQAMSLIDKVIPEPTEAELEEYYKAASQHAFERGVTYVNDMGSYGGWKDLATYRRVAEKNKSMIRMYAFMPLSTWSKLDSFVQKNGRGDDMLKWGGLKGYVDGSLGSTTAWFHLPYLDDPTSTGLTITDTTDLRTWVKGADKAGLHVAVHAIGDRANDFILSVYEDADKSNGSRDRRFRVEHAQHVRLESIENFAKQHVIASMHPYHLVDDGIWAYKRLDEKRLRGTYAFREMMNKGVAVTFGSDWPVAPVDALFGIYAAVTRQTGDGKNPGGWYPDQKISIDEALTSYTANNAYASFMEGKLGVLKAGYYADFAVLDQDLHKIDPVKIKEVKVVLTVLNGKEVYKRN